MDPTLLLMLVAVFFSYYISATFGFGDALILLPILSIFVDLEVGIIFTGFWAFPQALQQVVKYWHSIDRQFLIYFLPTVIPGIFFGIWLLMYLSSLWMQLIIGIFIVGYVCYNFYSRRSQFVEKTVSRLHPLVLLSGGAIYGTVSSWVGTPGPVSIIFLEYSGHYREAFIANNTAIVVLAGIFKLSLYLINGLFPEGYSVLFLGGLVLCVIATKLGHLTTPKISVAKFQMVINIILAVVGVRMIYTGIQSML
ncbi:MAG: sulfite exporter TauE/SafE family protein [Promethearchaeota archaeon]